MNITLKRNQLTVAVGPTESMRLEFVYGYSILNRFDIVGHTHYFQSQLQFQL